MQKVVLVTGSSSGIGYETSLFFARNGYYTYSTTRKKTKNFQLEAVAKKEGLEIETVVLDLNKERTIIDLFEKIKSHKNKLDVLVNNAGFGLVGPIEELSINELRTQFETNFFGPVRLIQNALPIMRKQTKLDRKKIINVSSVAGRIGFPLTSAYSSSKFALEGLSESIRYELSNLGIDVIIVEPGIINTNFGKNMLIGSNVKYSDGTNNTYDEDFPYSSLMKKRLDRFKTRFINGSDPKSVAKLIYKISNIDRPNQRYIAGADAIQILKNRQKMTDIKFEDFIRKSIM